MENLSLFIYLLKNKIRTRLTDIKYHQQHQNINDTEKHSNSNVATYQIHQKPDRNILYIHTYIQAKRARSSYGPIKSNPTTL